MNTRSLGIGIVFIAGCAFGGASARFVVPPASAQQAATLTKWEYMCFDGGGDAKIVQGQAQAAGAQGWEVAGVASASNGYATWCFKRPKM